MASGTLEERVAALETELADLKTRLPKPASHEEQPWWEAIYGTFAGSTEYDEAMQLGREWRKSQTAENENR